MFGDVRWAWLWLILRLYVGYEWLMARLGKLGNPAWTGANAGAAMSGFVNDAIQKTAGEYPDEQGWYAWFLQNLVLPNARQWSYLITYGEILGLFTGIAAFFGSIMNVNYLLAGAVSTNPILFAIATWLVLAWKTAGWWGLDRWVLPTLGTPWRPGLIFRGRGGTAAGRAPSIPEFIPNTGRGGKEEDQGISKKTFGYHGCTSTVILPP